MLISKKNRHHLLHMSQIMPIFALRLDLKVNRNLKCVGDGSSDTAVSFFIHTLSRRHCQNLHHLRRQC